MLNFKEAILELAEGNAIQSVEDGLFGVEIIDTYYSLEDLKDLTENEIEGDWQLLNDWETVSFGEAILELSDGGIIRNLDEDGDVYDTYESLSDLEGIIQCEIEEHTWQIKK